MSILAKITKIPLLPFWIGLAVFVIAQIAFYAVAFSQPDDLLPPQDVSEANP